MTVVLFAASPVAAEESVDRFEVPGRDCVVPTYVVQQGDWLWKIARKLAPPVTATADVAVRARFLYRQNQAVIGGNPNRLRPGMILRTAICA